MPSFLCRIILLKVRLKFFGMLNAHMSPEAIRAIQLETTYIAHCSGLLQMFELDMIFQVPLTLEPGVTIRICALENSIPLALNTVLCK